MSKPPRPGDVLAGKYEVERVIGTGGMGVVVAAKHLQLDERVALKFLLPEALEIPEAVARFAREARAAAKIKSEHVARVTDVGTLETGAPFLVMEYLDGRDLNSELASRGPLPVEEAVDLILQACEAIAEAHSLGIVHRDIKPGNLFLARRPDGSLRVKVLDFGISKMGFARDAAMTTTAAVMGSPLYMSPEQMEASRDVDARSDIWSLGVVLYEAVTRKVPFIADNLPQLVKKLEREPPPPLATYRPDAPPELQKIIDRCLAKRRVDRFPNVGALALALAELAPRSAHVSVGRITRVLANAGTLQDFADSSPTTAKDSPPVELVVSAPQPEKASPSGSETVPGSPQAMSAETATGPKTLASDSPGTLAATPAPNVATAAPWSSTSSGGRSRTKLGLRIGAVAVGVIVGTVVVATRRSSAPDATAPSASHLSSPGSPESMANTTVPGATIIPVGPGAAATLQESAPPSASATAPLAAPAVSAVLRAPAADKAAKGVPSAAPRPLPKPPTPGAAKPAQPAEKPAATPARPGGLFDDRR